MKCLPRKVTDNFQTIVRLFNDLAAINNQRALLSRIEVMTNNVHPAIREISFLEYPSLCKKIKILQKLNSRDNVDSRILLCDWLTAFSEHYLPKKGLSEFFSWMGLLHIKKSKCSTYQFKTYGWSKNTAISLAHSLVWTCLSKKGSLRIFLSWMNV